MKVFYCPECEIVCLFDGAHWSHADDGKICVVKNLETYDALELVLREREGGGR